MGPAKIFMYITRGDRAAEVYLPRWTDGKRCRGAENDDERAGTEPRVSDGMKESAEVAI